MIYNYYYYYLSERKRKRPSAIRKQSVVALSVTSTSDWGRIDIMIDNRGQRGVERKSGGQSDEQ